MVAPAAMRAKDGRFDKEDEHGWIDAGDHDGDNEKWDEDEGRRSSDDERGERDERRGRREGELSKIKHIVVIYEENHSFDNLYGGWEHVNGRSHARPSHTIQIAQNGAPYNCLLQNDVNLTSPSPLATTCTDAAFGINSHFPNAPFSIGAYIPATALTCPQPGVFAAHGLLPNAANLPGGCTEDIVHRFYQEQYQLNGGMQNRYTTGSDAVGLTMGYYDTKALPIYKYLHAKGHPDYAIADRFFQSAFGGSFLNHQWLIAAASPTFPAPAVLPDPTYPGHSILDVNGMPNSSYPLYHPAITVADTALTQACGLPTTRAGFACGDFAVNTIQPLPQPHSSSVVRLPLQHGTTIGDELSSANVGWAWYSGGWSNANGDVGAPGWTNGGSAPCSDPNTAAGSVFPNCPNKVFQYHHQPFNYFAAYAPGMPGRAHLRDEEEFVNLAETSMHQCKLESVSFVKPIGLENEHPGYTSEVAGSDHLVDLLEAIEGSKCRKDTMVIVIYDEFGGQWDHVPPPGQGTGGGVFDEWGPGTRIPALILAPGLEDDFVVDHASYDTTSILATIEKRYHLMPLGYRDGHVHDLSHVFEAEEVH
jgi:phospholipase C